MRDPSSPRGPSGRAPRGAEGCLTDLLLDRVGRDPHAVAVADPDGWITALELATRARRLGAHLRGLGVAGDDCVGLLLEPSVDLVASAWGILFSGGAYLPLSPDDPEERLARTLRDARAAAVVTQPHLAPKVAGLVGPETPVVTLPDVLARGRPALAEDPPHAPSAGHLAYVIYTSGSTGDPKGVMIEHRSIVNQMRWLHDAQGLDGSRVVLQRTPVVFDAAQWEILAPACGSKVLVADAGARRDPERLLETVAREGVTTLQCVPTLWKALLDTESLPACRSLQQLFSGGEALPEALARRLLEALPHCELVNLYGPTECTINASAQRVRPGALTGRSSTVPIGTPVHGTRWHILDQCGRPVGDGEVGELHIAGVQVARGYLNRPQLTRERFVDNPFDIGDGYRRLYRTGDLARRLDDGAVEFVGRADNQVKLRGFRVELDEVRLAIEAHDWVKDAAVVVREQPATGQQALLAFVELSPKEAALMDQGRPAAHHQSKEGRLQTRAQLSNGGCRDPEETHGKPVVALPGRTPTERQRRRVFARKTYRFFEGPPLSRTDVLRVLAPRQPEASPRPPEDLTLAELGQILRYFGQYHSPERLLPKYGYASPGALYATQLYLEVAGVGGLAPGFYYYHPVHHELVELRERPGAGPALARVHLVGKRRAIEPIYKHNVREVLEIEAGHLVGLFESVLPEYGLGIAPHAWSPEVMASLDCAPEDCYLGTFALEPHAGPRPREATDLYVQAHPGRIADLPAGQYRYVDGDLRRISDELVLRKHVVAINQDVYERSSLGISIVSTADSWLRYVDLGRRLHRLQDNGSAIGLMSSGYSSKSGRDLPSAVRVADILRSCGLPLGASYFCVGGPVSEQQVRSTGMKEDAVHLRGPTEMIADDLARTLPEYMRPNKVVILDRLPRSPSGKVDQRALGGIDVRLAGRGDRPPVPPRTATERRVAALWAALLGLEDVCVREDFFEVGGNSLLAVALVARINREFASALPQQALFECPTIERLARRLARDGAAPSSRLVRLGGGDRGRPVYVWPGLGGSPMNLRPLAGRVRLARPILGVQAVGLNEGEAPYSSIEQIAAEDLRLLRSDQPAGPYTLWGYSFGARVAFEVACRLEQAGEVVDRLVLLAPGMPRLEAPAGAGAPGRPSFDDPRYVAVLLSVFAGGIPAPLLEACLAEAGDEDSFTAFVCRRFEQLDPGLVRRIVAVVRETYGSARGVSRGRRRPPRLAAPVTVMRARGDEPSFAEVGPPPSTGSVAVVDLRADHYAALREPHVEELVEAVEQAMDKEGIVPHVNIKHFPARLSQGQLSELVISLTSAISSAFDCDEGVVSIALEPVEAEAWHEQVYVPEIVDRKDLLCKDPDY